jgi:hypothetical protein
MQQNTFTQAEQLTENLFSLTDPWRGRFLTFVAQRALGPTWNGQLPTKEQVTTWLGQDSLCQTVTMLFTTWEGTNSSAYEN